MIVVVEGYDGAGKSTVAEAISKFLDDAPVMHFPNDNGHTGPMIRSYLKAGWSVRSTDASLLGGCGQVAKDSHRGAMALQALQVTNRMEFMTEIKQAKDIVLDRYWQSGMVYGQLDGLDPAWLTQVHKEMAQGDVNILLDVSPEQAIERQKARGGDPEIYEAKAGIASQAVELYRKLWTEHSHLSEDTPPAWLVPNKYGQEPECGPEVYSRYEQRPGWPIVNTEQPMHSVVAQAIAAVQRVRDMQ